MNQIEHIIWDWNGTILNDAWLCVEIINEMLLKRHKTPISEKFYSEDYLKHILLYHKMINIFRNVSGLSHILADSKIENGKILMKKLNIPKEKCIFIGDTIHDIDTAQAMGVKCWLFPSGHNSRKRLEARTDKIINQFSDIVNAIM